MNYTERRQQIEAALDSCGIGHDLQQRLDTTCKRIAELCADVCAASTSQALHDGFVNRPQEIKCGTIGKDDAERAFVVGVVSVLGALAEWDINSTRRIAADLLEDVNDHEEAARLRAFDRITTTQEIRA